jgi:dTDP-4-amino-4,6-dideoxygalactose transaminase
MNDKPGLTRRTFLASSAVAAAAATAAVGSTSARAADANVGTPALLGGTPAVAKPFPAWPVFDAAEEQALLATLRSGHWFRGSGQQVERFETAWAKLLGAPFCIGTSSGTNALIAAMNALGVGAGDEVILPPYTFVACADAVLMLGALPVFVDVDPDTFQLDTRKVAAAISERTAAIMPVHIGGSAVDLDAILAVARERKIPVVEDACQAHLGEWRGRKLGTIGDLGCFSFQASKNLTAGEGGAIVTDDEALAARCYAAHNNAQLWKKPGAKAENRIRGSNFRMSEFHASLLAAQLARLPEQAARRDENAAHLTQRLSQIEGLRPAKLHDGCTRSAYHLFMMRYDAQAFAGLPRAAFLKALAAEGVPASSGYRPLNKEPFIAAALRSRGFRRAFPEKVLSEWAERTACPVNDRLCDEAVWFPQNALLASPAAMDQIAAAVGKIKSQAREIARRFEKGT